MQMAELIGAALNIEWWRYVWIPIAGTIFTWLINRGKSAAESLGARDGSIQTREDKLFARYNAEISRQEIVEKELRADRDAKDKEIGAFREYSGVLLHLLLDARHKAERLHSHVPPDKNYPKPTWKPIPRSPDDDEKAPIETENKT